jgi:hypothetical protein
MLAVQGRTIRVEADLEENMAATVIDLTADDLREIDEAASGIEVLGTRGTGQEQYG